MKEVIIDTLLDSLKLLPFLFLTYLLMEFIEHKAGDRAAAAIGSAGKYGPLLGSLLGVVPQCGFSASASSLYSGGVITAGTLVAVFLSTSDEMLPVCISESVSGVTIAKILIYKVLIGIVIGFGLDLILKIAGKNPKEREIHSLCRDENCGCEEGSIFTSAFHHTLHIALFILAISFVLNTVIYFIGEENLSNLFVDVPVIGCAVSALVGLIPNCAASVVITELYISGVISAGCLMSGLLAGSGVGIPILFRLNKNSKQNFGIMAATYASAVVVGSLFDLMGVTL